MASLIHLLANGFAVAGDFNFEVFADVHGADPGITHVFQRALDGFALGVEDGLFWRNDNLCFHVDAKCPANNSPRCWGKQVADARNFFLTPPFENELRASTRK